MEAGCVISGSPATVRDQILEFARECRIGNLHAMIQLGSMPHELAKNSIELFAKEVLPDLQELWRDEGWQHNWWPERLGGASAPTPYRVESMEADR